MCAVKWLEKMKSESAKIGIGRSNLMKNRKSESAQKIVIGASLGLMTSMMNFFIQYQHGQHCAK